VWDLGRATDMLADRRCAITDITTIIRTLVRLTGTTGLTGLWVVCLSAPARGMAGEAVGVVGAVAGVDAAVGTMTAGSEVEGLGVGVASTADAALRVGADSDMVRLVDSTAAAGSTAVLLMVAEGSTAEVASTVVEAVDTLAADTAAADTAKHGLIRNSLIR